MFFSVFQCNKCNTIILGETSAREHVSGCLQDEVDQQDWASNVNLKSKLSFYYYYFLNFSSIFYSMVALIFHFAEFAAKFVRLIVVPSLHFVAIISRIMQFYAGSNQIKVTKNPRNWG